MADVGSKGKLVGKASRLKKMRRIQGAQFEKKRDIKSVIRQVTWFNILCGAFFILVGGMFIFEGIEAYKTGALIPGTFKVPPMTGPQSILAGSLIAIFGIFFGGYEIYKIKKTK